MLQLLDEFKGLKQSRFYLLISDTRYKHKGSYFSSRDCLVDLPMTCSIPSFNTPYLGIFPLDSYCVLLSFEIMGCVSFMSAYKGHPRRLCVGFRGFPVFDGRDLSPFTSFLSLSFYPQGPIGVKWGDVETSDTSSLTGILLRLPPYVRLPPLLVFQEGSRRLRPL